MARLKNIFSKKTYITMSNRAKNVPKADQKPAVPDGLWKKCKSCGEILYKSDLEQNLFVCPKCGQHLRISAKRRIYQLVDQGSFKEMDKIMADKNPLNFPEYSEKLHAMRELTGTQEAVIYGLCTILGEKTILAVMDSRFMMGSMGSTVGEKITRAIETATQHQLPVIIVTCSGGARMQEGILSLMQMAKTSAAIEAHGRAGLPYFTVITDPTTGGVTASFAMLGDVILSEPGALIGFAGQRVIEQTIGQKLPEGFQRAEFMQEHGFVDHIVHRKDLRQRLYQLLRAHRPFTQEAK